MRKRILVTGGAGFLGSHLCEEGDGQQTRSFCHVDDLIQALIKFMATPRLERTIAYFRAILQK
jgi:nucleoside-diphosphate-sugar epimerase